jgi:hypothetical protein
MIEWDGVGPAAASDSAFLGSCCPNCVSRLFTVPCPAACETVSAVNAVSISHKVPGCESDWIDVVSYTSSMPVAYHQLYLEPLKSALEVIYTSHTPRTI